MPKKRRTNNSKRKPVTKAALLRRRVRALTTLLEDPGLTSAQYAHVQALVRGS